MVVIDLNLAGWVVYAALALCALRVIIGTKEQRINNHIKRLKKRNNEN